MAFLLVGIAIVVAILMGLFLWKQLVISSGGTSHFVSLEGKHVVITGGSSGIGFALARECLSQGASITLIARNPDRLSHAAHLLSAFINPLFPHASVQDRILLKAVDVCDATAISKAIVDSFEWKPIDILICNAGISINGPIDTMKVNDFDVVTRTNLLGCVYPVHAAVPLMKARSQQHPSSIVLMSSLAGLLFVCGANVYTPTKYAIKGLAEVLRFELMPHSIKVSLVCPGFTETPLLDHVDENAEEAFELANKIVFYDRANAEAPEEVARRTMEGVKKGKFLIVTKASGIICGVLGRGFVPADSLSDALMELFLLVPSRLLSHLWFAYAKIVLKKQHHDQQLSSHVLNYAA